MAEVFIDPSASSNGTGTEISPKNTYVGLSWASDTRYKQKRGTTYSSANSVTVGASGASAAAPIVIEPYGSDAAAPRIVPSGSGSGVNINARAHVQVLGMDLDTRGSTGSPVLLQVGANNVKIVGNTLRSGAAAACVNLSGSSVSAYSEIDVNGNTMLSGLAGVRFLGTVNGLSHSGFRFVGNTISDMVMEGLRLTVESGLTTTTINDIKAWGNVIRRTGDVSISVRAVYASTADDTPPALWGLGCELRNNDIADCGTATSASGSIHVFGSELVRIYGNTVRDCYTLGALIQGQRRKNVWIWGNVVSGATPASSIDGCGIFADRFDDDIAIFGNRISECRGLDASADSGSGLAIWMATNVRMFGNHVSECRNGIIAGGNAVKATATAAVHSNTFENIDVAGFLGDVDGTGFAADALALRNNLFLNCATAIDVRAQTLDVCDYNAFDGCDTLFAGGQSAGANDLTTGLLLTGFRPLPGSPLLTSGVDLGYLRDIERKQGKGFIGAYAEARLL